MVLDCVTSYFPESLCGFTLPRVMDQISLAYLMPSI